MVSQLNITSFRVLVDKQETLKLAKIFGLELRSSWKYTVTPSVARSGAANIFVYWPSFLHNDTKQPVTRPLIQWEVSLITRKLINSWSSQRRHDDTGYDVWDGDLSMTLQWAIKGALSRRKVTSSGTYYIIKSSSIGYSHFVFLLYTSQATFNPPSLCLSSSLSSVLPETKAGLLFAMF